jgi:hypothetical protein
MRVILVNQRLPVIPKHRKSVFEILPSNEALTDRANKSDSRDISGSARARLASSLTLWIASRMALTASGS